MKDFIKRHNEENNGWLMFIILKNYMNFIKFYHFYLRGLFLLKNLKKVVANFHDKSEYIIHIRNLNQALNHGLVLKKVHRVIKFDQNAWIKAYIDMKTDLRKVAKYNLEKYLFKWWIMQFLEKPWEMWENIEMLNSSQEKKQWII